MESKTILVTGSSIRDHSVEPLVGAGHRVIKPDHTLDEGELREILPQVDAYLYGGDENPNGLVGGSGGRLRLIAFYGVGYESFLDVEPIRNLGIRVTNTPSTLDDAVAEMTIGQLLNCRRKLTKYALDFSSGAAGGEALQMDVRGHVVGIVGMGGIGTRLAEILSLGFKADVVYFSRTRKKNLETALDIRFLPLQELLGAAEMVLVMVPGNLETQGLIGAEQFAAMPDGAILVNTARPDIVEPTALLDALKRGRLHGCAFDKFYDETKYGSVVSELLTFQPDPLLITNHIGSLTTDARDAMANRAVRSILSFLEFGTDDCLVV